MGTRSTIALEFADGTVEQVYCHWDGYLEHNGKILAEHYMDPFKVKQLLALGAFSSLDETVEETKGTAYHFSRGEEMSINKYKNVGEYFVEGQQEEYDYILRNVEGVATWFVRSYATSKQINQWVTLEVAFEQQSKEEEYDL
jgi:hypothetical protein